ATLTPGVLAQQLPRSGEAGDTPPERTSFDAKSGVDLGGESFSTRGGLLEAAAGIWSRNPVLGQGWNSWGWAKSSENHRLVIAVDPHNGLLWLAAEAGALGLLLLYAVPVACLLRRPWLLWLWSIPTIATLLELVNPNLRNGHFAVAVWSMIALAILAPRPVLHGPLGEEVSQGRPPLKTYVEQWRRTCGYAIGWLRGGGKPLNNRSET
ncbi:MAG: hypothetical protein ACRDQZ_02035, partial [Mycobacteriales bacterium]